MANDWSKFNAAHRALISARQNNEAAFDRITADIGEKKTEIVALEESKKRILQAMSEIDTAVAAGGFMPPAGYNMWGEKL